MWISVACSVWLSACALERSPLSAGGAERPDGATRDGGALEAGARDGGAADADSDASPPDADLPDGSAQDAGLDAAAPDAGSDAGSAARCGPSDALVGCWNFDGDYADSSGHGFDLSPTLTTLLDAHIGQGVYFSAASSLTRTSAPLLETIRSVAFFARPDAPPFSGRQMFFDKNGLLGVRLLPGNRVECGIGATSAAADGVTTIGRWIHIVCSADTSGVTLYINGIAVGYAAGPTSPASTGDLLRFGEDSPSGGDHFLGFLDEFRAYSRPLTALEANALASATGP